MTRDQVLKIVNIVFPVIGVGLMIFYGVCDTSCSSLQGTFMGVDLKWVGIGFMAALLTLNLFEKSRFSAPTELLRIVMLAGAVAGEVLQRHGDLMAWDGSHPPFMKERLIHG